MTEPEDERSLSISWSSLRTHEECRQKAHLIRNHKSSPVTNLRPYFHGMVVDTIMQLWLRDEARQPGQMAAMVETKIGDCERDAAETGDGVVWWKGPGDRDELREFCTQLVINLEPILYQLVLPYRFDGPQRFKTPVKIPYLDGSPVVIFLRGEMDLLVHTGDGREVWDLKGTRDNAYWRKVMGQLIFYDLADFFATGVRPNRCGLIQPMCDTPVLEFRFTDDERRSLQARIIAMATDIWRHDVTCKPTTGGCGFCSVRHACSRFAAPEPSTLGGLLRASSRS